MIEKHEIQKFRHRGFQPDDGSEIQMMFNDGPIPLNADGTQMKVLWDNDIEQHITVRKHLSPLSDTAQPAADAPAPLPAADPMPPLPLTPELPADPLPADPATSEPQPEAPETSQG